jgi:multidrug transporter EmrE-like cation transporter
MAWMLLVLGGQFEVSWALALGQSQGFTKLWPSVLFGVTAWLSFAPLSQALGSIPIGTSYAAWTGIGAVGVAIAGIAWFRAPASPARIACIALIVAGVADLRLDHSFKPFVLLFDEFYTELYRISEAQTRMLLADRIVFMGTSFSVNITRMALDIARGRDLPIEIVDPDPVDVGYWNAIYHPMTALEYVETQ